MDQINATYPQQGGDLASHPNALLPCLSRAPTLDELLCVLLEVPKASDNYTSEKAVQLPAKMQPWSTIPCVVSSGQQ